MTDYLIDLKQKCEAISASKRTDGRMTKYYKLLGEKGGLGQLLGFCSVRKSTPKISAVCFENAIICQVYGSDQKGSTILGALKLDEKLEKVLEFGDIKVSRKDGSLTYKNKSFINAKDMMNGKELLTALGAIFDESNTDLKSAEKKAENKADTDIGEDLEVDTTQKVIKLRKKRIVKLKPKVDPEAERKLEPELPVGLTDERKRLLFSKVVTLFKSTVLWNRGVTVRLEDNGNTPELSMRYLGDWYNDSDEDDEDYDWEVPTDKTRKAIDLVVNKFNDLNKGVKLSWNYGEKNWIYFEFDK